MVSREHWPAALPPRHADFLAAAVDVLAGVDDLVGIAAGGSFISGEMDEMSDLDLVLACEPASWPDILGRRKAIASGLGPMLAAFTGEHVGEPRLLICLYGPPLLHVDLKFVSLDDAHLRVEDPVILWESEGALSAAFARSEARYPAPDPEWIEDRIWIWAHFLADKIERGELFHAIEMLTFLRARVLGPMELERRGLRPDGVRRIEAGSPDFATRLRATVASHDPASCLQALEQTLALYRDLRDATVDTPRPGSSASEAERAVATHVAELRRRLTGSA